MNKTINIKLVYKQCLHLSDTCFMEGYRSNVVELGITWSYSDVLTALPIVLIVETLSVLKYHK